MAYTLIYPKGEVEHNHFSLKCLKVKQSPFLFFISLLCTLKWDLKSTAETMYSSLHLSQVIKYMTFLLLQERSPFIKYVLPVIFDVNSVCKCHKNYMVLWYSLGY